MIFFFANLKHILNYIAGYCREKDDLYNKILHLFQNPSSFLKENMHFFSGGPFQWAWVLFTAVVKAVELEQKEIKVVRIFR